MDISEWTLQPGTRVRYRERGGNMSGVRDGDYGTVVAGAQTPFVCVYVNWDRPTANQGLPWSVDSLIPVPKCAGAAGGDYASSGVRNSGHDSVGRCWSR